MIVFYICGKFLSEGELVKIIDEVESLQEKNKSLEESVIHYQKVIEGNLAGVRYKELEKVIKELESVVVSSNEMIEDQQRELGIRYDEIHNLKTELKVLGDCCDDLSECNKAGFAKHKEQQAIIEFQKKDIERLVKLNVELQNRLDTYKKVLYFSTYSEQ